MKQYGFTACERGVIGACESEIISNPTLIVLVLITVILFIFITRRMLSPKKLKVVAIQRKIIGFYGLAGFSYESKVVSYDYFYGNSAEMLSGDWCVVAITTVIEKSN